MEDDLNLEDSNSFSYILNAKSFTASADNNHNMFNFQNSYIIKIKYFY